MKSRWNDKYSDIEFDDFSIPLRDRISKSRLVVIDHFGSSTLLETLTINKPVVVFGNTDLFEIRNSAEPFYDELYQAGILHYEPEYAADTINSMYHNVQKWWDEPERRNAAKRFAYRFALNSSTDAKDWAKALRQLANAKAILTKN